MTIKTFFLGSPSIQNGERKRDWIDVLMFPFGFCGPNMDRATWLRDPTTGKIAN